MINEITAGNNPVFDDLRTDPDVKRFVINRLNCAIGSVTKDEALAFGIDPIDQATAIGAGDEVALCIESQNANVRLITFEEE